MLWRLEYTEGIQGSAWRAGSYTGVVPPVPPAQQQSYVRGSANASHSEPRNKNARKNL